MSTEQVNLHVKLIGLQMMSYHKMGIYGQKLAEPYTKDTYFVNVS